MCKPHEKHVPTIHRCPGPECRREPDGASAREHRAIDRIVACTDERGRRLVAGFLARLRGHGGITPLATITGLDRNPIARGRRELDEPDPLPPGRVRRPGAGSKPVETRRPES